MNVVFTIAQNRSLANAILLGKSLQKSNANLKFIIGLVDVLPIDFQSEFEIINVLDLKMKDFDLMQSRYTSDELLGATKLFFVEHLLNIHPKLFYFEVKSEIQQSLNPYFELLESQNMVLVPQLNRAGQIQDEKLVLNTGMFSSAVFGIKKSKETEKILDWWLSKMPAKAGFEPCIGIYSDQLWMNHIPVFFKEIFVDKSERLNVGLWNNTTNESSIHFNYSNLKKTPLPYKNALKTLNSDKLNASIPKYGRYQEKPSEIKLKTAKLFQNIANGIDDSIKKFANFIYK